MIALLVLLALLDPTPTRVYVFTAKPEFIDAAYKDRVASLADVREALSKRKEVVLVDDQAAADVSLEIVSRREDRDYNRGTRLQVVSAALRRGTYQVDVTGEYRGSLSNWRDAAKDVARLVGEWARDNSGRQR